MRRWYWRVIIFIVRPLLLTIATKYRIDLRLLPEGQGLLKPGMRYLGLEFTVALIGTKEAPKRHIVERPPTARWQLGGIDLVTRCLQCVAVRPGGLVRFAEGVQSRYVGRRERTERFALHLQAGEVVHRPNNYLTCLATIRQIVNADEIKFLRYQYW